MKSNYRIVRLVCALLGQLVLIGFFDFYTGYEIKLGALYALPVAFAAWYLRSPAGWLTSLVCALITLWAEVAAGKEYSSTWIAVINTASRLAIFVFIQLSVSHFRRTVNLAKKRLRAFEGLLPVCCACHRVDGGDGFWTDFPAFLRANTQAQVEFKTCPSCSSVLASNSKTSL
ncbi:hypothetical protein [Oleiharenicola lentus]|uniref:hypothetical protein n=1 Tax=Oleiharenicola lentus TaxID=2508720 RepID=UPI003F664EF9